MAKISITNAAGKITTFETQKLIERDHELVLTGRKIELKEPVHIHVEGDLDEVSLFNANIDVKGSVKSLSVSNGDIQTNIMQGTFESMHGEDKNNKKLPSYIESMRVLLDEESCKLPEVKKEQVEQTTTWYKTLLNMFCTETTIKYNKQEGVLFARFEGNIGVLNVENGNVAVSQKIDALYSINGDIQSDTITGSVKTISGDLYAATTVTAGTTNDLTL